MAKRKATAKIGLSVDEFKDLLAGLIGKSPIKIWLAKSALGRLDVVFSVGDTKGKPARNFDHIGGFYLLGENVPDEYVDQIHRWFVQFCQTNYTPYRLERHFIDVRSRAYFEGGKRYHDEFMMHVPMSVRPPTDKDR
ncbi:MAG TPA: hypothetical protein PJ991_10985 [Kiritimatiellia bacterium]|nr:hypothetical protein [Kiritimatiellia bacterium]